MTLLGLQLCLSEGHCGLLILHKYDAVVSCHSFPQPDPTYFLPILSGLTMVLIFETQAKISGLDVGKKGKFSLLMLKGL